MDAGLSVLKAGPSVLEAGPSVFEAPKQKIRFFQQNFNVFVVFPGHTELFPGHVKLFPNKKSFVGHTDLLPGHTVWRLGGQTGCLYGWTWAFPERSGDVPVVSKARIIDFSMVLGGLGGGEPMRARWPRGPGRSP